MNSRICVFDFPCPVLFFRGQLVEDGDSEEESDCEACVAHEKRVAQQRRAIRFEWNTRRFLNQRYFPPTPISALMSDPTLDASIYTIKTAHHHCILGDPPPFERPLLTRLSFPLPVPMIFPHELQFVVWCHVMIPVELPRPKWKLVSKLHLAVSLPQLFSSWRDLNPVYISGKLTLQGEQHGRKKKLEISWNAHPKWDRKGLPTGFTLAPWVWRPAVVYAPRFDGQVAMAGVELLSGGSS